MDKKDKRVGIKVNRNTNMITVQKKQKPITSDINLQLGKVPGLPKDFLETVLDCEVKLKEKFDMKVLHKLVDYYSTAVGYYESINDPKFMIYNQSLSLLFSQPEVKQYLAAGGNLKLKLKKENVQKKIQESDKKITTDKVKSFIRRKTVDSKKTINNLINKDMDTQSNDFKKRLAAKKQKYKLSTSDRERNNDIGKTLNNMGLINSDNKSIDLEPEKEFIFSDKDIPNVNNEIKNDKNSNNDNGSNTNNIQVDDVNNNNTNNILDELKKEDLKNENEKNNKDDDDNNNLNDSFEKKLDESSNKLNKIPNKNSIKYTNKTMFLEKTKLLFDIYSNDYYDHFIKKIADQIIKDYNDNYKDLTQTLMASAVNYINQEKEMEFLLTTDSDESYKKEIGTIVQQLKDEEKVTKDKLIAENKGKIERLNDKYM